MQDEIKDLQNVNEIDMEMDASLLDDEDDFGSKPITNSKPNKFDGQEIEIEDSGTEDRPLKSITGIKIDLSDDVPTLQSKTIKVTDDKDLMDAVNDVNTPRGMMMQGGDDFSGYNGIDMECSVGEDDDDYVPAQKTFDLEDEDEPELVSEEMIEEKRKKERVSQGKVEADYWDRLSKKHKDSNVKGAHNLHTHYGGDPKLAMDLFNHDVTPGGKIPTSGPAAVVKNSAGYTTDISSGDMSGGEGMACCGESKEKDNNKKLFEELLVITGFKLQPKEDNNFIIKDVYGMNDDMECCDEKDCINKLRPYIDDTFIIPLQIQTGQKFEEPEEWVNWYTPENEKQYPKCKQDIDYCKMLLNYLK